MTSVIYSVRLSVVVADPEFLKKIDNEIESEMRQRLVELLEEAGFKNPDVMRPQSHQIRIDGRGEGLDTPETLLVSNLLGRAEAQGEKIYG